MKNVILAIFLALVFVFGALAQEEKSYGKAAIGGSFNLVDYNNNPVSNNDFNGKYMLVYFGFTSCVDICPTDLSKISDLMDRLGNKTSDIAALFITIDPERDTVDVMKNYLLSFNSHIIGLTGTKSQVDDVAAKYRIYYKKADNSDKKSYMMEHSGYIYLMDKSGEYITHFSQDDGVEDMVEEIKKIVR